MSATVRHRAASCGRRTRMAATPWSPCTRIRQITTNTYTLISRARAFCYAFSAASCSSCEREYEPASNLFHYGEHVRRCCVPVRASARTHVNSTCERLHYASCVEDRVVECGMYVSIFSHWRLLFRESWALVGKRIRNKCQRNGCGIEFDYIETCETWTMSGLPRVLSENQGFWIQVKNQLQ